MQSLVVGNGESRNLIDLNAFSKDHILIGCNALHRDLIVDHLVCCDRRMVEEAVESPNTSQTKIYAREDWFKYYRKIKKDRRKKAMKTAKKVNQSAKVENLSTLTVALEKAHQLIKDETGAPSVTILVTRNLKDRKGHFTTWSPWSTSDGQSFNEMAFNLEIAGYDIVPGINNIKNISVFLKIHE